MLFRFTNQVAIDDEVLVYVTDQINPTKVINVSRVFMQGNHYSRIIVSILFINIGFIVLLKQY